MKRASVSALLVLSAALSACEGARITSTVTNVYPGEIASMTMFQNSDSVAQGNDFIVNVTTRIVGRSTASLADTTFIAVDNPQIVSFRRAVWVQNQGFDSIAQAPYVEIGETYFGHGLAVGTTIFSSRKSPKDTSLTITGHITVTR